MYRSFLYSHTKVVKSLLGGDYVSDKRHFFFFFFFLQDRQACNKHIFVGQLLNQKLMASKGKKMSLMMHSDVKTRF